MRFRWRGSDFSLVVLPTNDASDFRSSPETVRGVYKSCSLPRPRRLLRSVSVSFFTRTHLESRRRHLSLRCPDSHTGRDSVPRLCRVAGPGILLLAGAVFKLFGTNLLTARAVLLLTGAGTALLVFHLSRRIGGFGIFAAIFVLATSIPLAVMNSPHYDSNLFGLLAFAVFCICGAQP